MTISTIGSIRRTNRRLSIESRGDRVTLGVKKDVYFHNHLEFWIGFFSRRLPDSCPWENAAPA